MTIITQNSLILNYRYIREIGLYDAEDDSKNYFCLISAKNEKGEDVSLGAYSTSEEGESVYSRLVIAFLNGAEVFSFAQEEPVILQKDNEQVEVSDSDKPSYKNRFIAKDR